MGAQDGVLYVVRERHTKGNTYFREFGGSSPIAYDTNLRMKRRSYRGPSAELIKVSGADEAAGMGPAVAVISTLPGGILGGSVVEDFSSGAMFEDDPSIPFAEAPFLVFWSRQPAMVLKVRVDCPAGTAFDPASLLVPSATDCAPLPAACMRTYSSQGGLLGVVEAATCPAGTFAEAGSTACTPCPLGTRSEAGAGSCTECPQNTRGVEGGLCVPCAPNEYTETSRWTGECKRCRAGTFLAYPGAALCSGCPPGEVSAEGALGACAACPAGSAATKAQDECRPCAKGTARGAGDAACVPCPGILHAPLANSTECIPCPAGSIPSGDRERCEACPPGTYQLPGQASCIACRPGTYSAGGVAGACGACPLGSYPSDDAASCVKCEPGYYMPNGTAACVPRGLSPAPVPPARSPSGTVPRGDRTECSPCEAGTVPVAGKCSPCPPRAVASFRGYFAASEGAAECAPCAETELCPVAASQPLDGSFLRSPEVEAIRASGGSGDSGGRRRLLSEASRRLAAAFSEADNVTVSQYSNSAGTNSGTVTSTKVETEESINKRLYWIFMLISEDRQRRISGSFFTLLGASLGVVAVAFVVAQYVRPSFASRAGRGGANDEAAANYVLIQSLSPGASPSVGSIAGPVRVAATFRGYRGPCTSVNVEVLRPSISIEGHDRPQEAKKSVTGASPDVSVLVAGFAGAQSVSSAPADASRSCLVEWTCAQCRLVSTQDLNATIRLTSRLAFAVSIPYSIEVHSAVHFTSALDGAPRYAAAVFASDNRPAERDETDFVRT
eukprot:tig00021435_g21433.t1